MEVIFGKMFPCSSGNRFLQFLPGAEISEADFSRINQIRFRETSHGFYLLATKRK